MIEDIKFHENFTRRSLQNDIALVRLTEPAVINRSVRLVSIHFLHEVW